VRLATIVSRTGAFDEKDAYRDRLPFERLQHDLVRDRVRVRVRVRTRVRVRVRVRDRVRVGVRVRVRVRVRGQWSVGRVCS
jgi:hypothetical protein